jgi:hypothetical protein
MSTAVSRPAPETNPQPSTEAFNPKLLDQVRQPIRAIHFHFRFAICH